MRRAAAAAKASGYSSTPEHDKELVAEGKASKVIVLTTPSEADIYIDGKNAGKTPTAFYLYKHEDADRLITIKLAGYNPVEKKDRAEARSRLLRPGHLLLQFSIHLRTRPRNIHRPRPGLIPLLLHQNRV